MVFLIVWFNHGFCGLVDFFGLTIVLLPSRGWFFTPCASSSRRRELGGLSAGEMLETAFHELDCEREEPSVEVGCDDHARDEVVDGAWRA